MTPRPRWRRTVAAPAAAVVAFACAVVGLAGSRPDIVVLGLPVAVWALWGLRRPKLEPHAQLRHQTEAVDGSVVTAFRASGDGHGTAEAVQVSVDLPDGSTRGVVLPDAGGVFHTRSRLLHSGPVELASVTTRLVAADGAQTGDPSARVDVRWNAAPSSRALGALPLPRRLTGLHGAHEGSKPGQGGDFRDIHQFAPGDELRRVDWRATARLARRPDDLYVRRMLSLSDATVVLVVDTTTDLGESVASWGTVDPERSGVTSLDITREAGRSIAEAAIGAGDRLALHELAVGGRAMRTGGGARHLAHAVAALSALAERDAPIDPTRLPPVPAGALVCVLSPFFDGAAARAALTWRAGGRRVLAVDTLPLTDDERLTAEQRIAARILLDERADVFRDLRRAGVDVVRWAEGPDAVDVALRVAHRRRT